jgi:SAM-dependent methyltransferase
MPDDDVADPRVARELENYTRVLAEGGVSSSIASSFTYWATHHLRPRLKRVFETGDINDLFAREIASVRPEEGQMRVLSLGSGDCTTEIEVMRLLVQRGNDVHMTCTDLNPVVTAAAHEQAGSAGFGDRFSFAALNLNGDFVQGSFHAIMANHSLHHFEGLEFLLSRAHGALLPGGVFVVSDMIGRNGHMRWPEALPFVENLWNYLPRDKRFNRFAQCYEEKFSNYDCTSDDTFEGIRAQDILPLLTTMFRFKKFVAYGNIPDVFVDRIYGQNLDPEDARDAAFIDYLESLNVALIDAGVIKPTMMLATLTTDGDDLCTYDRWGPEYCVRIPD